MTKMLVSIILRVLFLACLLFPMLSNAALPTESGLISSLQIHKNPDSNALDSHRYILKIDGSSITENNCGSDQWTGYLNENIDSAMLSTLLALYIAKQPVKVEGTSPSHCMGGGVLIRNLYPL